MEESDFGKLGRDGFTSILLRMRPIDVVKLCWLTNMHLCDNVDWKTLLRVGFELDDPEEIEDDPADQRMQFYNIACSIFRPFYIPAGEGRLTKFKEQLTGRTVEGRRIPPKMKFLDFIDSDEVPPADLPKNYYYYPTLHAEELQRPVFPEGEKCWVVVLPGFPNVTVVDTSVVTNSLRNKMRVLGWEYPQEDDRKEWGRLIAANYCTEAVLEDIGSQLDTHFRYHSKGGKSVEIFSYIHDNDYYVDGDQVYQIGEVEFLPISK